MHEKKAEKDGTKDVLTTWEFHSATRCELWAVDQQDVKKSE
jgi:hypothetical protein